MRDFSWLSNLSTEDLEYIVATMPDEDRKALRQALTPPNACLDERMKAAGMFTVAELMGETPMTRWEIHTGVRDMDTFGQWLDMKVREYLTMKAAYALGDKDETDDLYEWVLAHAGAFTTIRTNFKAAIERSLNPPPAPRAEG